MISFTQMAEGSLLLHRKTVWSNHFKGQRLTLACGSSVMEEMLGHCCWGHFSSKMSPPQEPLVATPVLSCRSHREPCQFLRAFYSRSDTCLALGQIQGQSRAFCPLERQVLTLPLESFSTRDLNKGPNQPSLLSWNWVLGWVG